MSKLFLTIFLSSMLLCVLLVVIVDPYFHFHAPFHGVSYRLGNERYINDGIGRHFEYDAIITGTSMTQNFRKTWFDRLFDADSVKLPFAGGSYKEISEALKRTLARNENVSQVLWGLDYGMLNQDKNAMRYSSMPEYLYDDKWQNDLSYLLNKETCVAAVENLIRTGLGKPSTTMDEYSSWTKVSGQDAVLAGYQREKICTGENVGLTNVEAEITKESVDQNIVLIVESNPDIKFYLFLTPYSIVYWDSLNQAGEVQKQIEREQILLERLIDYPNVEIYCFFENTNMICNLDNYGDPGHYLSNVNEDILQWIKKQEYRITRDNMEQHISKELDFYLNYEYDAFLESE